MRKGYPLFTALLLFFVLLTLQAFALEGMITRLEQDGNVVINKGMNDQMKPQAVLYVTRMNTPVAKIQVIQVDDYNSICKVLETMPGQKIERGDLFSQEEFKKPVEETPSPKSTPDKKNTKVEKVKSDEEILKEKMKKRQEYEKDVNENFKKAVQKKTKAFTFKRGAGGAVKVDAFDTYNFLSTVIFAGKNASINPWYIGPYAWNIYSSYKTSANPNKIRNVQIEIIHWDAEYLDAYSAYYAYKEVVQDPRRVKIVRDNIYRQKGLDKFYVFQVRIANPGPGAFQLAPFPWHFYLEGKDGKRLKADHYDEILDKALNPNQVVNGYVYFQRYDQQGQPVTDGKGVTIQLEDILGHGKKVNF